MPDINRKDLAFRTIAGLQSAGFTGSVHEHGMLFEYRYSFKGNGFSVYVDPCITVHGKEASAQAGLTWLKRVNEGAQLQSGREAVRTWLAFHGPKGPVIVPDSETEFSNPAEIEADTFVDRVLDFARQSNRKVHTLRECRDCGAPAIHGCGDACGLLQKPEAEWRSLLRQARHLPSYFLVQYPDERTIRILKSGKSGWLAFHLGRANVAMTSEWFFEPVDVNINRTDALITLLSRELS